MRQRISVKHLLYTQTEIVLTSALVHLEKAKRINHYLYEKIAYHGRSEIAVRVLYNFWSEQVKFCNEIITPVEMLW